MNTPHRSSEYWQSVVRSQPKLKPLLLPRLNRYIPHTPLPKQAAFLWLTCREAFYGGAAGGGKSDALLMAALQYVDVPGYAAILFRRTYKEATLPNAIMARSKAWLLGTDAKWHDQSKTWHFPSGATLTFGYLDNDSDLQQYQSAELQFVGFDELTHFDEKHYTYLFSRLRRLKGVEIPIRMRSASNPGSHGHEWVKKRFITEGRAEGRIFIPAGIDDNTHLDQEEYRQALSELDPVTRLQLEEGNWDIAAEGNKFRREWIADNTIPALPEGVAIKRLVRYWDLAATEPKPGKDPDYTCGALLAEGDADTFYALGMERARLEPLGVDQLMQTTAAADAAAWPGKPVAIWIEQEPGSSGKRSVQDIGRRVLRGYDVNFDRVTGSKEVRANPLSSAINRGIVKFVDGPWLKDFIAEAVMFPPPAGKGHDDQIDAMSGAYDKLTNRGGVSVIYV